MFFRSFEEETLDPIIQLFVVRSRSYGISSYVYGSRQHSIQWRHMAPTPMIAPPHLTLDRRIES